MRFRVESRDPAELRRRPLRELSIHGHLLLSGDDGITIAP